LEVVEPYFDHHAIPILMSEDAVDPGQIAIAAVV